MSGAEAGTGTTGDGAEPVRGSWWREHAELGVAALLGLVGALVLVDTLAEGALEGPAAGESDPIGLATVPLVLGTALLLLAGLLALDVLRGGRGEAEGGEDVDLDVPMDLRTVGMLAGVLVATAALVPILGWPIAGTLLFAGSATALGSRTPARDLAIAAAVSLTTWIVFDALLGVDLPGGPLMGVLGA